MRVCISTFVREALHQLFVTKQGMVEKHPNFSLYMSSKRPHRELVNWMPARSILCTVINYCTTTKSEARSTGVCVLVGTYGQRSVLRRSCGSVQWSCLCVCLSYDNSRTLGARAFEKMSKRCRHFVISRYVLLSSSQESKSNSFQKKE